MSSIDPEPLYPQLKFDSTTLPIGQLESLRFKISQIIDSIQNLQRTIELGLQSGGPAGPSMLPPWPDVLAKYNLLVSQTHTLSASLSSIFSQPQPPAGLVGLRPKPVQSNPFEKLALHPQIPLQDSQLDNELIPLLRNQQTTQVLNLESSLVERIRKSQPFAVSNTSRLNRTPGPNHEQVLQTCESIRTLHDARIDRALRAVTMLRDKYDWKARVEITFPVSPPPEPEMPLKDAPPPETPDVRDEGSVGSSDEVEELEDVTGIMMDMAEEGEEGAKTGATEEEGETPQSGIFTPS